MKTLVSAGMALALLGSTAFAATSMTPPDGSTITNYYKQNVYSPEQSKLGEIDDVLVDNTGKITGLVVSVGGFLGMDSKDVIVPFTDVSMTKKDNKAWLTLPATKDQLKAAPGYTYDKTTTTWTLAKS
jgi:sporulation protein YlmC with PRC-barrel domain